MHDNYTAPVKGESLSDAWIKGRYVPDGEHPIHILMGHSDCSGTIDAKDCLPLAEALDEIIEKLPDGCEWLDTTRAFSDGLKRAALAGEDVDFH